MGTNYFLELQKVKCEVEKKNGLNYISWSDGWAELKRVHPTAVYQKIKNGDTYLFRSGTGGSVECSVSVNGLTHTADLAVTDMRNQEIKYEAIKSTDIQNTLQRAFAKAIAMHGIGLYVYRGEDFPEEDVDTTGSDDLPTPKAKTYDTPTGGTRPRAMASKDESCPSCGFVNTDIKKGTTKEGKPYEKCDCKDCGTTYFINRI